MPGYLDTLSLPLANHSESARWRHAALAAAAWTPQPVNQVSYTGLNRLLVVADAATAAAVAARLSGVMQCYGALTAPPDRPLPDLAGARHCPEVTLCGHLGRFRAMATAGGAEEALAAHFAIERGHFDQVLDCGAHPLIAAAVPPPGYHYVGADESRRAAALAALPNLIGEFEKPKYFDYDPDICAHGRRGVAGCNRCLEACPTGAITSLGDRIEVDPHLCQGVGACTATCPSGAIRYTYPAVDTQLEFLRTAFTALRANNGQRALTLLVFDNEHGRDAVTAVAAGWSGEIIPLVVEDIGSVGLDLVATALAYGAARVSLYVPPQVPAQVRAVLEQNLAVMDAVLTATGCTERRVEILSAAAALPTRGDSVTLPHAATFAPIGDKRTIVRAALGFFAEQCDPPPEFAPLPPGAPFGRVNLDIPACTLCMSCVAVCPSAALEAGGDTPILRFIEANCVQCGMCERACPEDAITLQPRLLFATPAATALTTLKEEAPFCCIRCGKPFATQAMISRMREKLRGHHMFTSEEAFQRLEMCDECRVVDMFAAENESR